MIIKYISTGLYVSVLHPTEEYTRESYYYYQLHNFIFMQRGSSLSASLNTGERPHSSRLQEVNNRRVEMTSSGTTYIARFLKNPLFDSKPEMRDMPPAGFLSLHFPLRKENSSELESSRIRN